MNNAFITRIAELQRDPLSAARATAKLGQRVIGYVGDVPIELIFAANALPIRLQGDSTAPTPHADAYLESSFMPEIRAVLEQWLSGQLDFIDVVIFSRSNDSAQRLYYYLSELQRTKRCGGPTPVLFDVATISRSTSSTHTLQSVQQLATTLRSDAALLPASVQRVRDRVLSLDKLSAQRIATSALSSGDAYRASRAAEYDWSTTFDSDLRSWLSSAPRQSYSRRLLLVGNTPPDERLHVAAVNSDAAIVSELTDSVLSIATDESLVSIANRHHAHRTPAQQMLENQNRVVELARETHVEGVIFWAIEEDEVLPWEVARQTATLAAAHIPVLSLTRQQWLSGDATSQRVSDFARTLEAR